MIKEVPQKVLMSTGTVELTDVLGGVLIGYQTLVLDIPQRETVGSSTAETPLSQAGRQIQN